MAKKSCKKGYYYCYASKKCRKLPRGYAIGMGGYLRRERGNESSEDNDNETPSNGSGSANGESNGASNGGGEGGVSEAWSAKYKKSIDCNNPKGFSQKSHCRGREKVSEGKSGDHEVAMAQSQLKKSARNIAKLRKALGKKEKDIPAWMQAKITDTAHDTDAAAGYADKMSESKSGDSSLRDWFSKSKSSDGKPGWVQLGGKYAGKPCAKQPGQKTKPKCGSSKMAANLDDKEEKRAFNRKQRQDPNPNRKGKAINVKTESYSNWRTELDEGILDFLNPKNQENVRKGDYHKDPKHKKGTIFSNVSKRNEMLKRIQNQSYQPEGEMTEGLLDRIKSAGRDVAVRTGQTTGERVGRDKFGPLGGMIGRRRGGRTGGKAYDQATSGDVGGAINTVRDALKNSYESEGKLVDEANIGYSNPSIDGSPILYSKGHPKVGKPVSFNKAETKDMDRYRKASKKAGRKIYVDEPLPEETEMVDEGKKDACYHKVKSRYSVWPSAYASGALVKCRKKGAANWGNKTKKESYDYSDWRDDFKGTEYESIDIIKPEPLQATEGIGSEMLDEKCWKGYEKKGMKTMFGKKYPNCVKKKKTSVTEDWQKSNRKDGVDGMSQKSVNAYKRENPGSKLKTAVTGNPKKGSKDSKRRKSFCARSKGQKDMHNIDCTKTPDKKICKARKRWKC